MTFEHDQRTSLEISQNVHQNNDHLINDESLSFYIKPNTQSTSWNLWWSFPKGRQLEEEQLFQRQKTRSSSS